MPSFVPKHILTNALCLIGSFSGVGVVFAVAGAVLIVIGAPDTEDSLDTELLYRHLQRPVFMGYISTITAIAIACYVALRFYHLGEKYIVIPLFITAVLGSYVVPLSLLRPHLSLVMELPCIISVR